jgi:hypothetical protein
MTVYCFAGPIYPMESPDFYLADILRGVGAENEHKQNDHFFFSRNTSNVDKEQIQGVVGIPSNQHYDTYLGLPTLVGRSRIGALKSIKERV